MKVFLKYGNLFKGWMMFYFMGYEEVHAEVLKRIREGGGLSGLEYYNLNKGTYEGHVDELHGKLEIVAAVEEKEKLLGVSIQVKEPEGVVTTENCIDHVIEVIYATLDLDERRDEIPVLGYGWEI